MRRERIAGSMPDPTDDDPMPSLIAAFALASVHVFSPGLRFLREIPRSRFLSVAGGISVAYVVLRILPGLVEQQREIEAGGGAALAPFLRNHAYVLVLLSIVVFSGLERLARQSRRERRQRGEDDRPSPAVFWLHISTLAVVSFLIGYVLPEQDGFQPLFLFSLAMLLKFVVNDHGLYADYKERYYRTGRWILAAATLLGWGMGYATGLPPTGVALLQAFIAGAVILNVLKEELPEARESRYWAFALGAVTYAALLLAL